MKNTEAHHPSLTMAGTKGLYDLSMLEEMDDTEYLLEVLEALLQESPKDIAEMTDALRLGKTDIVCKKAHKLKSSAGVIQAEKLTAVLEEIELTGKKNGNAADISLLIKKATAEYNLIEKELNTYISKLK